jgi:hypothetical protein
MATRTYDPITSIEGMFNGSITRIAQAIRSPAEYGLSTKGVLLECSKRFQDALDDCEIQILDAKFYLENQLAQNKARREAKAKEETAATAKRKHDEIKDVEETEDSAKRVKLDQPDPVEPQQSIEPPQAPGALKKDTPAEPKPAHSKPQPTPAAKSEEPEAPEPPEVPTDKSNDKDKNKEKDKPPDEPPLITPLDEFPKATPNATPAPTNDDFNFESMFGEPSADLAPTTDDPLQFDLDLDSMGAGLGNDSNPQETDLNSFLPSLESYTNQASDDPVGGVGVGGTDGTAGGGMNFGLPNLEPNEFDAFLDANDFGTGGEGNFMTDDAMNTNPENVDFDSIFN